MQVPKIQNNTASFGRYESYLFGFEQKFPSRRLHDLGRVCDILVSERRVPFYLKWLKGDTIFNIKVGYKKANPEALLNNSYVSSANITAKQLKKDRGIITRTAVRFAKELGYID